MEVELLLADTEMGTFPIKVGTDTEMGTFSHKSRRERKLQECGSMRRIWPKVSGTEDGDWAQE